ncbi:helix-turn-helix domain-containing protein [Neobacillus sp. SAB-20_R2A]|uniref:helix-turn-helix domain-containing protein n=1 Tax=Neobacillus sp. SAB-20_R2A TaxID=3120519 RepID=UPI003C6E07FB
MNYRIILGQNIHKYRKIKGLSQEKLAEACNLHRTYIGAVERGERNIAIDNIGKICAALDIDIEQLFEKRKGETNEKL